MKRPKQLQDKSLVLVAERFKVLGDPLRLRLLHLLCDGERSVGDLVDASAAGQANVSKHLQILLRAGFLLRRKEGLLVFYRIADDSVFHLCETVCGRLGEQFRDELAAIGQLGNREPRRRRRRNGPPTGNR